MPDPTYKTFLSPGSCQLEVTDLVASANDDIGVDLYGVAWEIEQVLIAGEGFAASPTDVWVNERGILNIGQSLFDKINRTAEDNDNVPGQCTVVVKATSLVDSSKVARLKVLVGYPGEGGGGGGVDFGPYVLIGAKESVPVVDGNASVSTVIQSLAVDGTTIITTNSPDGTEVGNPFAVYVAGGFSVETYWQSDYNTCTPYLVTIGECEEEDGGETYTYLGWKSVEPWDGTITKETQTGDFDAYRWLFDVPVMDGNDYGIILVMSSSS